MSCGVGRRRGSDPVLLWLWYGPAATAPIRPLAWKPPYAMGAALEMAKRPKKKVFDKKTPRNILKIVSDIYPCLKSFYHTLS